MKMEQIKLEAIKDMEKIQLQSEDTIKSLKYIYEQEKLVLQERMEKCKISENPPVFIILLIYRTIMLWKYKF